MSCVMLFAENWSNHQKGNSEKSSKKQDKPSSWRVPPVWVHSEMDARNVRHGRWLWETRKRLTLWGENSFFLGACSGRAPTLKRALKKNRSDRKNWKGWRDLQSRFNKWPLKLLIFDLHSVMEMVISDQSFFQTDHPRTCRDAVHKEARSARTQE